MKKIIMSLVAIFAFSVAMMAQDCCKKGCKETLDKDAFAKQRTEDMATRYGLNETQKAQLLELNKSFFAKYAPKGGCCKKESAEKQGCCKEKSGAKECCKKGAKEECKGGKCDKKYVNKASKKDTKEGKKEDCANCPNKGKCDKQEKKSDCANCPNSSAEKREEIKVAVANYKAEIKKIFTEEQYTKYENAIKERVARMQAAQEKQLEK